VPVIVFIIVAVIAYLALKHTAFGHSVYAIGGNPVTAWISGLNVNRILFSVYFISGLLAALAGLLIVSRTMAASMVTATGLELDSIASVAVGGVSLAGGRGNIIGVVIGVLIVAVVTNGMIVLAVNPAIQGIMLGFIILAAVGVDTMRRARFTYH
jgi:ribose/xylose/arabinose/galactoside ABC-type transport system permease subunit